MEKVKTKNIARLVINIDKKQYIHNKPIWLTLTITNRSENTINLSHSLPERDFEFAGKDSNGVPLRLTVYGKNVKENLDDTGRARVKLEPNQTRSYKVEISKMYNLTTPATYFIQTTRPILDENYKNRTILSSNEITFSVTD